jgi:hypothetical protein
MQTVKIADTEYRVPTSWDDITIRMQIELSLVKDRDEEFKNIHLISTYTGIPMDILRRLNINDFKRLLGLMDFLNKPLENKVIEKFEFRGKEYYLADSMMKGQTQDFLSIEGIMKRYKDNQVEALPYVIAIVAKQRGETLDSFDVWKRGEEFKDLPYSIANAVWFFFAMTEKALSIDTKQYLAVQEVVVETQLNLSESILKKWDGLPLSKRLLRTILLLYIRFIRKGWRNFLTGTQSERSKQSWIKGLMKKLSRKQGKSKEDK